MNERDEVKSSPPGAGAGAEDEHWHGYPGEPEAETYVVPARARYGAIFAILIFCVLILAAVLMMGSAWQVR